MDHVKAAEGLLVAHPLYDFVTHEALRDIDLEADRFWRGFGKLVHELAPRNRMLLDARDSLQAQIDEWHRSRRGASLNLVEYQGFLHSIGYLRLKPPDFTIGTANVDPEIATIAGPQLVVPLTNARYALNAANSRWGGLYDALYGTDATPEQGGATHGDGYNELRGARVRAKAREILDQAAPLVAPAMPTRSSTASATAASLSH